jgi:hypothetical protein
MDQGTESNHVGFPQKLMRRFQRIPEDTRAKEKAT